MVDDEDDLSGRNMLSIRWPLTSQRSGKINMQEIDNMSLHNDTFNT